MILNRKLSTVFLITMVLFVFVIGTAQTNKDGHEIETSHENASGEAGIFETVVSGLFFYTPEHDNVDLATEIHVTYWVTHTWAFGVGYTLIFEEENRIGHELAALTSTKPWPFLTVNFGPSFTLPNSEEDFAVSGYVEGEFNITIGKLHGGPVIGTLVGEEFTLFGGLHLAHEF